MWILLINVLTFIAETSLWHQWQESIAVQGFLKYTLYNLYRMTVMMNDIFMVILSNQMLCALYMQLSE